MQRISITNPQNIIDGTAKKYYFKLRNTGGPKGDKGDKGDTGATGPQGPQGDPCTVVVNSTATLEPGSNAYVTNTGSLSNAVLDFGIPKGDRGPQGAKGDKGDTGAQGETGPRGPQGERGTNATVSIGTTYTLAPGSQATVYNSGSDSNAVLNFGIPQGAKGDTGSQGPTGPAGQNFAPTIVAELPATGDESKLYLTPKAHTTQTATGNPITASVTEQAGALESFQLDGDTFQQSYTGKNLFNKNNYSDQTGYYIGGNGIWRSGGANDHYFVFNIEPNTTYTFSKNAQASNNRFRVGISSEAPTVGVAFPIWGGGDTATEITLTTASDSKYAYVYYSVTVNVQEAIQSLQIELGSTATSYEPYVGGQPSPSPDYPQAIQTVTGEQTVTIEGKNLFNKDKALDNYFYTTTGSKSTYSKAQFYNNNFVPTSDKITISYSAVHDRQSGSNIEANVRIVQYDASGNFISRLMSRTNGYTFTLDANTKSFILCIDNGPDAWFDDLQVEYGSSATAYAPYSHQSLPIDLGTIELCKLGTYQDYIYKDGSDWKVHKATNKITLNGSESWYNAAGNAPFGLVIDDGLIATSDNNPPLVFCDKFYPVAQSATWSAYDSLISSNNMSSSTKTIRIRYTSIASLADFETWLAGHNTILYYVLATAADTTITDTDLIAQLEAIRTASLENGTNTITNTATGSNIAGDMEIGYYGYNPTNRYDKWLWLDINNEYEQIGS